MSGDPHVPSGMSAAGGSSLIELSRRTDEQYAELCGDETDPFESDGRLRWREKDRYFALAAADGRLIAMAGLASARVRIGADPGRDSWIDVAGIGGVIVRADRRGEGLARRVVEAALARATVLGPPFALLFCWPDRAGLYARLGFARVDAPVTVDQPERPATMHMETMWRALRAGADWPAGAVALDGLPF